MAYVVTRPGGRFEIRESVHTPKGPRARSLANFEFLTDAVLVAARRRATRPFDTEAVRASARKAAGSSVARRHSGQRPLGGVAAPARHQSRRFVESSRRMAGSLESRPPTPGSGRDRDPGDTLLDLLNFAEQITAFTPERAAEDLAFPPVAPLADATAERHRVPARATEGPTA
jgi:hypothetical protein